MMLWLIFPPQAGLQVQAGQNALGLERRRQEISYA
jgi:hypothetical protein